MIRKIGDTSEEIAQFVERPKMEKGQLTEKVVEIFNKIKFEGDSAINHFNATYDRFESHSIKVTEDELKSAYEALDVDLLNALYVAKENIYKFHSAQRFNDISVETFNGVQCMQKALPIQKVGLYIPGGTAPLFSTILMLAIPAQIAGCKEIVLCSPPNSGDGINKTILGVAHLCGIKKVYNVGGAQAVAAMSIGTETIPKVDKIFGPGNQFVTAAKEMATQYGTAIDMPAGPSEVLVFGDKTANPAFIASDLLSQAEHGVDSHAVAIVTSIELAEKVRAELEIQINALPRKDLAIETFKNSSIMVCTDVHKAFDIINLYAPEHFIIASDNADKYIDLIENAGSVFLGNYTPESAGDYASGTNHTLPTYGWARSYSGVNLDTFMKKITFQSISKEGLKALGPTIIKMAEEEQLQAHANAVSIRLNSLIGDS
jgi:histidinol dehydrogenase